MTPIVNRPAKNARRSPFDGLRVSGWHCASAILPLMLSSSKHERIGCRRAVSPRCLSVPLLVAALLLSTGSAIAQPAHPTFPPEFVAQLQGADEIYVATVRKDGTRSSVVPVWFGWMDDAIWFTTSPTSHKANRIARGSPLFVSAAGKDGPFVKTRRRSFAMAPSPTGWANSTSRSTGSRGWASSVRAPHATSRARRSCSG